MGFFKDVAAIGSGIATGGLYSTGGGGLLQGGGWEGALNTATGGSYGLGKDAASYSLGTPGMHVNQDQGLYKAIATGAGLSDTQRIRKAELDAAAKQKRFYGSSLDNIGQESQDYVNMLKGNLNKDVARADIQQSVNAQSRGIQEAKAGLSGVDNTALSEGARRRSQFEAAGINEQAKREATDLYGKSIANRITGANTIENQEKALAIAQMKTPIAGSGGNDGLFGLGFLGL